MIHTVYLVGAGPGDPGLITVRGRDVLARAEVVIADRLVAPELLELDPGVELIVRGRHRSALPQAEINQLLVDKARAGKRVVRLKGGDPFVFGRGGEEAEVLHDAGIPFAIVPGITAAVAAPAYAGIPLTHRSLAGAVALVTGHEADDKETGHVDWDALAKGATTIVLYMSVKRLGSVAERLIEHGRPASTPVAVIERGTTPLQRTIVGTLADIDAQVRQAGVEPPALTVVGEVVRLRDRLAWFEGRPPPRRMLILSSEERARPRFFDELGEPIELVWVNPLKVRSPLPALSAALAEIARYREICLTSRHAVVGLRRALEAAHLDGRLLRGVRIAALEATAEVLWEELRLRADITAVGGGMELARALVESGSRGPVLFARGVGGREELPDSLRAQGIAVEVVDAYEATPRHDQLQRAILSHRELPFAAIAFASPRSVELFLDELDAADPRSPLQNVLLGAIGPTTAEALLSHGLRADVVPIEPRFDALVRALGQLASARKLG